MMSVTVPEKKKSQRNPYKKKAYLYYLQHVQIRNFWKMGRRMGQKHKRENIQGATVNLSQTDYTQQESKKKRGIKQQPWDSRQGGRHQRSLASLRGDKTRNGSSGKEKQADSLTILCVDLSDSLNALLQLLQNRFHTLHLIQKEDTFKINAQLLSQRNYKLHIQVRVPLPKINSRRHSKRRHSKIDSCNNV